MARAGGVKGVEVEWKAAQIPMGDGVARLRTNQGGVEIVQKEA